MADHDSFDSFYNSQLYQWNRTLLMMIGRWPYQNRKWRIGILILLLSSILLCTLGEVVYLVEVLDETDEMLKCVLGLTVFYSLFVMVINSIFNFDMMKEILENLTNNWMKLKNRDEMAIFSRLAMEAKSSSLLYFGSMVMSTGIYVLKPFISELSFVLKFTNESHPLKPVLNVKYYIDPSRYYVPIYINSASGLIFSVTMIFALDAYFITIIHHACGMYDVLGHRIEMIDQDNSKTCKSSSRDDREKLILKRVVECIEYHLDCIRFSESIEKFSNILWLMLITSIVFTLSITAVQTVTKIHEIEEVVSYGLCAVCTAIRLFYISLAGQKLHDHSLQIQHFAYDVSWYDLSPKTTKLLLPMLLRSSKPSNVTAGKLMPLNLQTFCSLMKVAMSYFTFLLSTR